MNVTLLDIDEMTHDGLATACSRDDRDTVRAIGTELREAVDAEGDSEAVVERLAACLKNS